MAHYCLVNEHRRFVVCVDAKCGSTTVRDWFIHTFPSRPDWSLVDANLIPAESVADYRGHRRIFVVRDPLRRLVSFYTQFVVEDPRLWCFADDGARVELHEHTFAEFLHELRVLADAGDRFQHHLEPQTRVLGSVDFDDVIPLPDLDQRIAAINDDLGVSYLPRRLNSRADRSEPRDGAHSVRPAILRQLPTVAADSFYDSELRALARGIYAHDVAFYDRVRDLGART